MQAVRFVGVGHPARLEDVPSHRPAPDKSWSGSAVRACAIPTCTSWRRTWGSRPPFTLGHENAGWVAELGQGVTGFKEGDAVAVYGPWGCGRCHACERSMENYCENWHRDREFRRWAGF